MLPLIKISLVVDETGAVLQGATVYAIVFGDGGPDAINSQIRLTNSSGTVTFNLVENFVYELFATIDGGYSPTFRDQMFNPDHARAMPASGGTLSDQTITLTSGFASSGTVVANVINATANRMIFGRVASATTFEEVAFGGSVGGTHRFGGRYWSSF